MLIVNPLTRVARISLALGAPLLLLLATLSTFSLTRATAALPNGVATGDTTQTSSVLWARGTTVGDVLFECSTDPTFSTNVLTATATVTEIPQPVKVEKTGLSPGTTYFYRATDADNISATGHFRTPTPVGTHTGLRFGVSGDWRGSLAPYPSIANADERELAFFVEHGDTIVAGAATTLEQYRLKHNEVYSAHLGLNTWADLRSSTSILATIDDNDVVDSFAGGAHPSTNPHFDNTGDFVNETIRYGNALQAFQEYNPLRDEYFGATGDPHTANKRKLYRFNTYGSDAAVFILDTRSFRDEPLPLENPTDVGQIEAFLARSLTDTNRTMLGAQQLADLKADLLQAQADDIAWKFILISGPIQNLGMYHAEDRFEGYAAERADLLRFIQQNDINNVVFIAASLHGTVVNNLSYQEVLSGPQIPTGALEVIVGPVAITPTFGPAAVDMAQSYGLITPEQREDYENSSRSEKDELVRQLIDLALLDLLDFLVGYDLNYDHVGLNGSENNATLLQGAYVAAHTYGWTEFEIDQVTQVLTVTTYGIDPYDEMDLAISPDDVITRTPEIVSQFAVTPSQVLTPVESVTLSGPITGTTSTTYTLAATVSPLSATLPITYIWQASDQPLVTNTNNLSDSIDFSWTTSGTKTVSVTAENGGSPVTNTRSLTITMAASPPEDYTLYLPLILKDR